MMSLLAIESELVKELDFADLVDDFSEETIKNEASHLSRWRFAFADYTIQHGVNAERRWGSRGAVLTESSSRLQPRRCRRARAHHTPTTTPTSARPPGWIIRCRALVKVQDEKQTNKKWG
ncbi:hypothetical protein PGIGA_G00162810 [Pangasianodon gigas]|uniref:Uncharacterized protein n=1 Tax=Pangasianodon gigas TaxID=30993 RepID=A0ACC5XRZ3_PANGG|nr:hypothetical protein [Pangasianodon gigas]